MKYSISYYISAGLLLTGLHVEAQKNEFSLYAGGGLHGLHYDNTHGSASTKPGFQAGVGYTHFLSRRWGIRSGLEIGYYHTRATLGPGAAFTSDAVDSEGQGFEYRVTANGYREDQKVYTVNIPLLLQFQTPGEGRQQFYALAGGKLGIPFRQRYTTSATNIETSGYYPDLNVELKDLPVHGFGKQTGWNGEGGYDLKVSFSLSAEAGMRFRLAPGRYLYAGAYLDYGLNDINHTKGNSPLLAYNPQGLAQSQATGLFTLAGATDEVKLIAYGVKIGFAFGGTRPKANRASAIPPVPVPAPATPAPVTPPLTATQQEPAKQPDTVAVIVPPAPAPPVDTLTAAELALLKTPVAFAQKGDTTLSVAAQQQVDQVIALLQAHTHLHLEVQGHTCDVGTDAVNERIGLARAKAVTGYMIDKGIDAARVQAVSKADREPLAPNTSETNRRQNRRVVLNSCEL